MDNENIPKNKKEIAVKIIIPILLLCAVIAIWAIKNNKISSNYDISEKAKTIDTEKLEADTTGKPDVTVTVKPEITVTGKSELAITKEPEAVVTEKPKSTITEKPEDVVTEEQKPTITEKPKAVITEKPKPIATEKPIEVNKNNPDFELHVTEKINLEKLKSYGIPIIIDFGADKCIPCKQMAPVLKEANSELKGKAIIRFVDVWKYQDFAEGFPVSLIPTQIFIDSNGNPYKPKDAESKQMKLYTSKTTGEHIFTAHQGGMTKEQLLDALNEMGMK